MASVAFLLSSCGQGSAPAATASDIPAESATRTPLLSTSTQTVTPTGTPSPSPTPTLVPRISVSENTNCRSGPGTEYPAQGVLEVGEAAEVIGRGPEPGFWFVKGADLLQDGCWLWGEFAQVEGEVEPLPVFTPAPSPTPQVGFRISLKSFEHCGDIFYVVLAVRNVGGQRLWSGYAEVQDFATRAPLYRHSERYPFADTVQPVCPPGHGNELWPGELRYIHVPLSDVKSGSDAIGIITLCNADHQGGTCVTEYTYFQLP